MSCAWRTLGRLGCGPETAAILSWDRTAPAPACRVHLDHLCDLSDALRTSVGDTDLIMKLILVKGAA